MTPTPVGDASIAGMADQLREGGRIGVEAGEEVALPGAVVLAAMGGSALGGELLRALIAGQCPVPVTRVRGFRIPHWAGPGTLVMCVSYSGDTEETLACARQAHRQGAGLLIVGAGGTLVSLAQEWGVPRAGAPRSPPASRGRRSDTCSGRWRARSAPAASRPRGSPRRPRRGRRPSMAARRPAGARLASTIPLIYGAGPDCDVAYRWKTQFNENAKMHAFSHALPEVGHNEIVGWAGAPRRRSRRCSCATPARARRCAAAAGDRRRPRRWPSGGCRGPGATLAARAFSLVAQGDWVSYCAALRRGVDPTPVATSTRSSKPCNFSARRGLL